MSESLPVRMSSRSLLIEPLTAEAFAPFGTVIQTENAECFPINQGTTLRFHRLAVAEIGGKANQGTAILSIFRAQRRPIPIDIVLMERHPLGSQAFFPLSPHDWLVVVGAQPKTEVLRCFRAKGNQGVQYATNVWHHPLLVLQAEQDFLILDRDGPGENLEEQRLEPGALIEL